MRSKPRTRKASNERVERASSREAQRKHRTNKSFHRKPLTAGAGGVSRRLGPVVSHRRPRTPVPRGASCGRWCPSVPEDFICSGQNCAEIKNRRCPLEGTARPRARAPASSPMSAASCFRSAWASGDRECRACCPASEGWPAGCPASAVRTHRAASMQEGPATSPRPRGRYRTE